MADENLQMKEPEKTGRLKSAEKSKCCVKMEDYAKPEDRGKWEDSGKVKGLGEICSWVLRETPSIVADLVRICRIRSVAQLKNPDCLPYGKGCRDALEEMLDLGRENGFFTRNYDNYVGRISLVGEEAENCEKSREKNDANAYTPENRKENIGIWAHLDVVDEGEGWVYPPYAPTVKEGYVIARGCQDNKSSAIVGLYVLKYFKEHEISLNHPVELYLGTCEEQGMFDIDYFLQHYETPSLSLVPDCGFPVCCGERGTFCAELTADRVFVNEKVVYSETDGKFASTDVACLESRNVLLDVHSDCGLYTVPDRAEVVLRYSDALWKICSCDKSENRAVTAVQELYADSIPAIRLTANGISIQASNAKNGDCALTKLSGWIADQHLLTDEETKVFELIREINMNYDGRALNAYCEDAISGPIHMVATQLFIRNGHPVIGIMSKYPVTAETFPLEERVREAAAERGFSVCVTRKRNAVCFDPDSPVAQLLTQASNEVLERNDTPFVMSGGTYAGKLPNAIAFGTGMPLAAPPQGLFAPGHGDYHQPDESIAIERIQKALEIYISGILRIDALEW